MAVDEDIPVQEGQMITLISSDEHEFIISRKVCCLPLLVKTL